MDDKRIDDKRIDDKRINGLSPDAAMQMVADIVTAYVAHNTLPASQIPDVIKTVHQSLINLGQDSGHMTADSLKPAVPIKKSVTDDYIICLEDGKQLKMLKRYLRSKYDMTPEDYRAKWNLPPEYPMVAPNYAKRRSQFAKDIGLGLGGRGGGRKKV
ncbi:putative MucR family transcriptional regulatory protein y4pD [alpha proteobacterium Q-1]|nr:putative MucR family transcriptional regulatory protein y4pD [alpha proteobacterium Q-1]